MNAPVAKHSLEDQVSALVDGAKVDVSRARRVDDDTVIQVFWHPHRLRDDLTLRLDRWRWTRIGMTLASEAGLLQGQAIRFAQESPVGRLVSDRLMEAVEKLNEAQRLVSLQLSVEE